MLQFWLAAELGAKEYGRYLFVMAAALATTSLVLRGLDTVTIRWTARGKEMNAPSLQASVLTFCKRQVVSTGLAGGLLLTCAAVGASVVMYDNPSWIYLAGGAIVPLSCLLRVNEAAFCGQGQPVLGSLSSWAPPLGGLMALAIYLGSGAGLLTAGLALTFHAIVQAALLVGFAVFATQQPTETTEHNRNTEALQRQWKQESRKLTQLNVATMIQSHGLVLLVGWLLSTEAVGQFGIAVKLAALLLVGIEAVNLVSSPRFAAAHAANDRPLLQRHASRSALLSFGSSLAALALILTLRSTILSWLGSDYAQASLPVVVLAAASVVNTGCGSVAELLKMTGHTSLCVRACVISACVGVSVSLVAVPLLGVLGAAISQAASVVCWNVLLARDVLRVLGVHSHIAWVAFQWVGVASPTSAPLPVGTREAA